VRIGYWWKRKETTRKTKNRRTENIKIVLRETSWGGMDWFDPAQDKDWWRTLVNMVISLRVPQNVGKLLLSCTIGGLPRRAPFI
jgi:hypothetical protein